MYNKIHDLNFRLQICGNFKNDLNDKIDYCHIYAYIFICEPLLQQSIYFPLLFGGVPPPDCNPNFCDSKSLRFIDVGVTTVAMFSTHKKEVKTTEYG